MAKGFFKEEGADVTGILSSAGGGTTLRNMLAGSAPYAEVNPERGDRGAIQQGADLKIISDNVLTVAEFVWAVKPDFPIKTVADLKGKKLGYTNPALHQPGAGHPGAAVRRAEDRGCRAGQDRRIRRGHRRARYRAWSTSRRCPSRCGRNTRTSTAPIARATEILPPIANVVGVARPSQADSKGDFIRGVIRARRSRPCSS